MSIVKLFKNLFLVLLFFVDIKVNASIAHKKNQTDIIVQPQGCNWHEGSCALYNNLRAFYQLDFKKGTVKMSSKAAVLTQSERIHILEGIFYISAEKAEISTGVGNFNVQGKVLVNKTKKTIQFDVIEGKTFVTINNKKVDVPAGYKFTFIAGDTEWPIPEPSSPKYIVNQLAYFIGNKAEIKNIVSEYKDAWSEAIDITVALNLNIIDRQMAAIERDREQQALIQKLREKQKRELMDFYYRRNFDEMVN